jgi:hypothetical protein
MNDENDIGIAVLLREAIELRDVPSDSGHLFALQCGELRLK